MGEACITDTLTIGAWTKLCERAADKFREDCNPATICI
jgi:hypothetical protein